MLTRDPARELQIPPRPRCCSNTGRPGASVCPRWFGTERPFTEEGAASHLSHLSHLSYLSHLGSFADNGEGSRCRWISEMPPGRMNERKSQWRVERFAAEGAFLPASSAICSSQGASSAGGGAKSLFECLLCVTTARDLGPASDKPWYSAATPVWLLPLCPRGGVMMLSPPSPPLWRSPASSSSAAFPSPLFPACPFLLEGRV